jgi:hypothetical protein
MSIAFVWQSPLSLHALSTFDIMTLIGMVPSLTVWSETDMVVKLWTRFSLRVDLQVTMRLPLELLTQSRRVISDGLAEAWIASIDARNAKYWDCMLIDLQSAGWGVLSWKSGMLLDFARLAMVMLMVLVENWISSGPYPYRFSKTDLETGAGPARNTNHIHKENFNHQQLGSKVTLKERGCRRTGAVASIILRLIAIKNPELFRKNNTERDCKVCNWRFDPSVDGSAVVGGLSMGALAVLVKVMKDSSMTLQ